MRTLLRSLVVLTLLTGAAQAEVLKVAASGGTHTVLQTALDEAQDGDIVVIDLDYSQGSSPTIVASFSGKGLTLVGDGPTRRRVPPMQISNVPSTSQVVLRNLEFVPTGFEAFFGGLLSLVDNAGSVLVEDCLMQGREEQLIATVGGQALKVFGCQRVSLARCQLLGGDGSSTLNMPPFVVWQPTLGGRAAELIDSRVDFQSCQIEGGDGGHDGLFGEPGEPGGEALWVLDSQVWLTGSSLSGGDGGFGSPHGFPAAAVRMSGALSGLRTLDSSLIGGAGVEGEPDAPGLDQQGGLSIDWPGAALTLTMDAPVRPGDASTIAVDGPPGTLFGFFTSFGLGFLPKTSLHGVLLGDLATFGGPLFINSLPPSGHFELPFVVPAVGFDGFLKVDQLISSQTGAGLVLSNASAYIQVENGL